MNYRFVIYFILISIILSSNIIFAETTGQLNLTSLGGNASAVTGVYGYTVNTCSSNADCFDYKCFLDFDAVGSRTTTSGLCNSTSTTGCIHDTSGGTFSIIATGLNFCETSTTYRLCTNGVWGSSTSCSGSDICSVGSTSSTTPCSANSSSSSSSS